MEEKADHLYKEQRFFCLIPQLQHLLSQLQHLLCGIGPVTHPLSASALQGKNADPTGCCENYQSPESTQNRAQYIVLHKYFYHQNYCNLLVSWGFFNAQVPKRDSYHVSIFLMRRIEEEGAKNRYVQTI